MFTYDEMERKSILILRILNWMQANPLAPLVYLAIYLLRPLTFFSATLLSIAGGFLFGPVWGIVYTVIAANASASPQAMARTRPQ